MDDDSDISLTFTSTTNETTANEELYKKFEEQQRVEFDQEKPLTFYLPSCHCLEERKKEREAKRCNIELREKEVNEILAPDHPALERFQKALKEHLLKQIERLNEEILELETDTKTKNAEKEEIGVEAYEIQQMVCKKQKILEEYVDNVKNATAAREEVELELKEYREKFKKETELLMKTQKEEKELRNEVETTNLLFHQTANWEKDVESDITISKRMTEKTIKDQMRLINEKRRQDMILYKLQSEVWKLETDLENTDMKLEVKERQREELAQAVAEGNTTIEALDSDYRCLMHSWNSVVIAISNRDRVLHCVNEELKKYNEEQKNIICETEKIAKMAKEEMLLNEKLTAIKQRILADIATCKNQTDDELAKQRRIERRIMKCQSIIEHTEKDIARLEAENRAAQTSLSVMERDWGKKNQIKNHWEEKIFLLLEDETTNSKASQHLALRLRQMKGNNRKLEITLALSENKNSIIQTKLESQISINAELSKLIKDLNTSKLQLEKELSDFQDTLKDYDNLIVKRQRLTDKLNNKVMEMVTVIGGREISPAEIKIKTLEKNIEEAKEKIKELQMFWMREQRNVLSLSESRQQQIANNDLLRKQILILQQKNLKVTDEIEAISKQDQKTSRNILNYHNQILMRSESLSRKKDERKGLDAHNDLAQLEFMTKLKAAEMECLKLEAQIVDIEEEKLILSKQLLDINREVLEWEKKLKIIVTTKNQIQLEKGSEGEIGQMRLEVHKMEVRYAQLKKAQERFMIDLEQCVFRRESIVAGNEAKEKRSKFGIEKTRFNFKRKMDDMRNQIKQIENGMKVLKDKTKKINDEKKIYENQMKQMKEEVVEVKKMTENVLNEYENIKTNKLMQFELLIMKQKKLNMYSDLARGKKPFLVYKTECALTQELVKNEEMNSKLVTVVDNLVNRFPHYIHFFSRIMNTLHLPKVYAGDINAWAQGVEGECVQYSF
ncbi:coiled-coil domain-containing protein 40 [Harmonia axyridis]|uniref:coiled-coil domain-containing protein 40 n=1 Tax=Harmonia axyridis TaxID=115357 RepID=UPI001E279C1E|nr:coiled-coil domain-containing protein 40 [Harmonia axyridis]